MDQCRNCGATEVRNLGSIGVLAHFFLKRVFRAELEFPKSQNRYKRLVQRVTERLIARIIRPVVSVEVQACQNCTFIQTRFPFADDALARLYVDYRSATYNDERIRFEPGYAAIADKLGDYIHDGNDRVMSLTTWLRSKNVEQVRMMLDYGGADGQFLPDLPGKKFVYEISDIKPAPGVIRIGEKKNLETYDFIQISHVLEHVPNPLAMLQDAIGMLDKDGFLFVEVPQDLLPNELQEVANGTRMVSIHEHINFYSAPAVTELLKSTGLKIIAVDTIPIESPAAKQFYIRSLAQRVS